MATADIGALAVRLTADIKDFENSMMTAEERLKHFSKRAHKVGKTMKRMGKKMTLAISAPLGLLGVSSVKAASDSEESMNKFREVFKGVGAEAENTADKLAKSFGMGSTTVRELLGDTGDLLTGFKFTDDVALDLSVRVTKLAADLASFTNVEGGTSRASLALTKAMLGETEQAKALGVVVRQDSDEFKELVKNFMQAEGMSLLQAKAMAALTIATDQSQKAQGDYHRTMGQLANQIRLMMENIKDLRIAFGNLLIEGMDVKGMISDTTKNVRNLTAWLNWLDPGMKKFIARTTVLLILLGPFIATMARLATLTSLFVKTKAYEKMAAGIAKMNAGIKAFIATHKTLVSIGVWSAIALAAAKVAVEIKKLNEATNDLKKSMKDLADTEAGALEKFGASAARLKALREQGIWIDPTDKGQVQAARELNWEKLLALQKKTTEELRAQEEVARALRTTDEERLKIYEAREEHAKALEQFYYEQKDLEGQILHLMNKRAEIEKKLRAGEISGMENVIKSRTEILRLTGQTLGMMKRLRDEEEKKAEENMLAARGGPLQFAAAAELGTVAAYQAQIGAGQNVDKEIEKNTSETSRKMDSLIRVVRDVNRNLTGEENDIIRGIGAS